MSGAVGPIEATIVPAGSNATAAVPNTGIECAPEPSRPATTTASAPDVSVRT